MKKLLIMLFMVTIANLAFAQTKDYLLSSHILDISTGKPAPNVPVKLEMLNSKTGFWGYVDQKITDQNGRIPNFLEKAIAEKGTYKLTFLTEKYFKAADTKTFYPFIEVVFEIGSESHYHVPITLSPFGYSTYRGN